MSDTTLYRASFELQPVADGRTLTGVAMRWDTPTLVRDVIAGRLGPQYAEAFAPSSADADLRAGAERPMFVRHDYTQDPIGMTTFVSSPAERSLLFDTPLARTKRADECLELVNTGAMRSVSVGFQPINTIAKRFAQFGDVKYRTGVSLRELSLAPTGFGAYPGAEVLAVRMDGDDDPGALMQAIDAIIDAAVKCLDPTDDDYNPEQAAALLTGADETIDCLLGMFGLVDADDTPDDAMAARLGIVAGDVKTRIAAERVKLGAIETAKVALDDLHQRFAHVLHGPAPSTVILLERSKVGVLPGEKPTKIIDTSNVDRLVAAEILARDGGVDAGTSADGTAPETIEMKGKKAPGKPRHPAIGEAAHAAMIGAGYSHIGNGTYQKGGDYVTLKRAAADELFTRMITEDGGKFYVKSADGSKNLGGPFDTKAEAEKRLGEVEHFAS